MQNLTIVTVTCHPKGGLLKAWRRGVKRWFPDAKVIAQHPPEGQFGGSNQHGHGINEALKRVKTDHILLLDTDCILLDGSWFSPSIEVLGARKGNLEAMHMAFLCGRTEILNQYDFTVIGTKKMSYAPEEDVGTKLGLLNDDLVFTGKCKMFDPTTQCEEIYYQDRLIATHFGRGSSLRSKVQKTRRPIGPQFKIWMRVVDEYNKEARDD